jgi:hypothetical protein
MRRFALIVLLFATGVASAGESKVGGRASPDGKEEIAIDLPASQHLRNKVGTDGLGLCVWTSITMSGDWCNEDGLRSLQQQMTRQKGGGWPERVDELLPRLAPGVQYVQYVGRDPSIIASAIRSGRMPCVTYGYSPRYVGPRNPGGRVAHMVNCVHYSAAWAAVLDNNFPGDDQYEWMRPEEFNRRWMLGNPSGGWVVLPLRCGPSPVPIHASPHPVIGQCWGGRPGPVGPSAVPHISFRAPSSYEWRRFSDDDSQVALYRDGAQVGGYSFRTGVYRPYDGVRQTWGAPCTPPCEPPAVPAQYARRRDCGCDFDCRCDGPGCRCAAKAETEAAVQNFGVRQDRIAARDGYSRNGEPLTRAEAEHALKCGGGFSDDSGKWRLSVVAPAKAKRDQVLSDLQGHALLSAWKERLCVQAYAPDAWAVTGVNLPRGGDPTLVVQGAPDAAGKAVVLHCQHDYDDGPDGLVKALRAADPNFNPKALPDLRRLDPTPAPLPAPPTPPPQSPGVHWLTVILSTAIPILLWFLGKSYPVLAAVLGMIWDAVKPKPPAATPTLPDLQGLLDRLSKLEQQQAQK